MDGSLFRFKYTREANIYFEWYLEEIQSKQKINAIRLVWKQKLWLRAHFDVLFDDTCFYAFVLSFAVFIFFFTKLDLIKHLIPWINHHYVKHLIKTNHIYQFYSV